MTQVPEHLLQRSRERRAALGLPPYGSTGEAEAPAKPAAPPPAAEAQPPETSAAPAPEAPVPAAVAAAPAVPEPEPVSAYVRTEPPRRVPMWMAPVLVFLPFWAVVYFGAFGERAPARPTDPVELGRLVYQEQGCGGCHGATGEGGVGPKLSGGEAALTFPNEADHVDWVKTGSSSKKGQPYGDPARPGGQHIAKTGSMPGFESKVSPEEIAAVVKFEREGLK